MTKEEFVTIHKQILIDNQLTWEWNCDLESIATGILYWNKNGNFLFEITGITASGEGDLEGFLKILNKSLREYVYKPIIKFNSGMGAILCNDCGCIAKSGLTKQECEGDTDILFCDDCKTKPEHQGKTKL